MGRWVVLCNSIKNVWWKKAIGVDIFIPADLKKIKIKKKFS